MCATVITTTIAVICKTRISCKLFMTKLRELLFLSDKLWGEAADMTTANSKKSNELERLLNAYLSEACERWINVCTVNNVLFVFFIHANCFI